MKLLRAALYSSAALLAVPAHAGDEVLFGPAPAWVEPADIAAALAQKESQVALLGDYQFRLEDGVVTTYVDSVERMVNPETLMDRGTLSLDWSPDKGDITIHRLQILRGDAVIDLVAQGVTFDVIRRELGLEDRLLDGSRTATLAVPGLREDDVLRISYSITASEQALGDEMQGAQYLPAEPWDIGSSRVIFSWPEDQEMYWAAEPRTGVSAPVVRDGYNWIRVDLPLAERPPIPEDAPWRFQRYEMLRVGTFATWDELSRVMAPHFDAAARVAADSPVAAQAHAIMARTSDPRERMALAVQLVQDEITYLANGLDGGNYLPQTADETWAARYGDCKAKSVLLVSLLRQMGITAETVLVTTEGGDAVPELLPLPLTFNHMIAHAVVDGQDYWLDGTSAATRLSNIADVPPFHWALPLRDGGTGLMAMVQRDSAIPQMEAVLIADQSAGTDFPRLIDVQIRASGPQGSTLRPFADEDDPDQLRALAGMLGTLGGDANGVSISNIAVSYDEEQAVGLIHITGVAASMFQWNEGRLEVDVPQGVSGGEFNPDRARPAWRDIPVATAGPGRFRLTTRVILPDEGRGFTLAGQPQLDAGYGNVRVERQAQIEDGTLVASSDTFFRLGEIAAAALPAARRAARQLEAAKLELVPPTDIRWRWELSEDERRRRSEPILAAFASAIAFADENDFGPLQNRALFLENSYDFAAALADYSTLIERSPSSWAHSRRAAVLQALDRPDEAIADLRAAYDLDADNGTAFALAYLLAYEGQTDEAEELVGYLPVGDDDALSLADTMATITGLSGDADTGHALIGDFLAERPSNANALNSDCWYRGLFNVALGDALEQCTRAVERAEAAAPPLDSRALVRFRLGQLQEAIADLDAALELAPGLAPSIYLRGVVRLTAGDTAGRQDIATALAMSPQLAEFYARHGVVPPR